MKTIAVVEDNPDNRLLVQVMLEPAYHIAEYETGVAALAGIQKNIPDLVLLDVSLPEMDGTEVLRRIRADARLQKLPVIALTANAMSGDREKYLAAGFDDYVAKPIVDEAVLLGAIQRHLAGEKTPANSAAVNAVNPLDALAIERLRKLGGDKFALDMIELFFSYGGKKVAETRQAHLAGDLPGVANAAHPLKSSAGNVGALQVQKLAATIEQAAKAGDGARLSELIGAFEQAYADAKAGLEMEKARINAVT